MGIAAENIPRVREASDILSLVQSRSALRRVGRRWVGLCPFHSEKTPSFNVNAEEGLYKCFGCEASGDVFTFVQQTEGLDFVGSVEFLAARAGITLTYTSSEETGDYRRRKRLTEAVAAAAAWYHERLLSHPEAAQARSYLRSRGVEGEQVREFRLGWAPDAWETLRSSLGLPEDDLLAAGLLQQGGRGSIDAFRARIMFPVCDIRGTPVGFGGRALPDGRPPKYKNSPESPVYVKTRLLYNLHHAKESIVRSGEVVICEGYTDVLGLSSVGVENCVATCGTSLTEDHVKLLRRFTERFVLAFDADAAGAAAAERIYRWEGKYLIQTFVASLPEGSDPGDLARSDPGALQEAVSSPDPYMAFRLNRAVRGVDRSTPEGLSRAGAAALGVIDEHHDEIVRDQYLMQVADRLGLPPDQLRAAAVRMRQRPPTGEEGERSAATAPDVTARTSGIAMQVLRICAHNPDLVPGYISSDLFERPLQRAVFEALRRSDSLGAAISMLASEDAGGTAEGRLLADLAASEPTNLSVTIFGRLVHEAAEREIQDLLIRFKHTKDQTLAQRLTALKQAVDDLRLHDWEAGRSAEVAGLLRSGE